MDQLSAAMFNDFVGKTQIFATFSRGLLIFSTYAVPCVLQIVNLIEETGHFHITNTTFDFDLCSLDRSTVRKLQSYLDTSGLS